MTLLFRLMTNCDGLYNDTSSPTPAKGYPMDEQLLLQGRFLIGLGHIFIWLLGVVPIVSIFLGFDLLPLYVSLVSVFVGWYVRRHGIRIRSEVTIPFSKWL